MFAYQMVDLHLIDILQQTVLDQKSPSWVKCVVFIKMDVNHWWEAKLLTLRNVSQCKSLATSQPPNNQSTKQWVPSTQIENPSNLRSLRPIFRADLELICARYRLPSDRAKSCSIFDNKHLSPGMLFKCNLFIFARKWMLKQFLQNLFTNWG